MNEIKNSYPLFYVSNYFILIFSAQSWANTLGIKNAKVYRISGFKKVDEYDIIGGEKVEVVPEKKSEGSQELVS